MLMLFSSINSNISEAIISYLTLNKALYVATHINPQQMATSYAIINSVPTADITLLVP